MPPDIEVNISGDDGDDALSSEANEQVVEEITDAAVQVAEIEAASEIAVAQIQAETSLEHHRIDAAMQTERTELQWQELQARAETAEALTLSLTAELDRTRAELQALTPHPSSEVEPVQELATGPEMVSEVLVMETPPEKSGGDDSPPLQKQRKVKFL